MRTVTVLLVTLVFCTAEGREGGLVKRQTPEDCAIVSSQLNGSATACLRGPIACVEASNFETFVDPLLCVPGSGTRERYDTFVGCQGQGFADEIWGGICGGPQGAEGPRCYTFVNQNINDLAASAIAGCCPPADNCSDECTTRLTTLSDQLGCCTQTSIYTIYFRTCGGNATLQSLYESCNVTLEDPCLHLYSGGNALGAERFIIAVSVLLSVTGLLTVH